MTFSEIISLGGNDWALLILALILLYMFVRRLKKAHDFLGIAGTISTVLLLFLLIWQGWNRYTTLTTVLEIAEQPAGNFLLLTHKQKVIEQPKVFTIDNVRYIIDLTDQKQTRYLPWNLVAHPR